MRLWFCLLQAEQLFLSSSEPRAALEMRKDLLQVYPSQYGLPCMRAHRPSVSVSISTSLLAPIPSPPPHPTHLVPSRPVPSLLLPSGARPRTRRHGLQWEHALKLAKTLAPHELPQISLKFGSHLEFRGEYQQARSHLGPFPLRPVPT